MIIGGAGLLLFLPSALLAVRYHGFVAASVAIVLFTAGWLLRAAKRSRAAESGESRGKLASWEAPVALAAILVTALWGYWSFKSSAWDEWDDGREAERLKAPAWHAAIDTLDGGRRWEEIRNHLAKEGFQARCRALGPNGGMMPGDTHACWMIAKEAWGIPARTFSFLFGPEGLRQVRIEFPPEQWPAVERWFDGLPGATTGTFGRDQGGNLVRGKMLKNGQVLVAEPKRMPQVMVLWQTRSMLEQTICKNNQNDPKRNLICNPSKP